MSVIECNELTKHFGDFTAVNKLTLNVEEGEIFGFLGPNGSGKTTVIKMLCGLLPSSFGKASVLGFDSVHEGERIRQNIGYMSQKFSLYEDLSVSENLFFYGSIYGLETEYLKERITFLIDKLSLSAYTTRLAGNLSGGWKQRLAFACAMIHAPKVLFLDEPTAGIDPVARRELWDIFFEYAANGTTFFVSTHYMDEAERCGRLGYIYEGTLIANGTLEALYAHPSMHEADFVRMEIVAYPTVKALQKLKAYNYVKEATIFGRSIHFSLHQAISKESLKQRLEGEGVKCEKIGEREASLEDLFVSLSREYLNA